MDESFVKPTAPKVTAGKNTPGLPAQTESRLREDLYRQILSSVSHDLKTPLATIIGSLEVHNLLERKLSEEKRRSLIASALSEAHRLDRFITNILDMAKLESGAVAPAYTTGHLYSLISDSITRLGPLKDRGDIRLHRAAGEDKVITDTLLLGRAVSLIIENALKHTGVAPVVDIDFSIGEEEACIHIRDRGPGIPPDKMKTIFSKYTRLNKRDQQVAGTGLGLAIAEQIMTLLEGRIEVSNHPETGAVFALFFPTDPR